MMIFWMDSRGISRGICSSVAGAILSRESGRVDLPGNLYCCAILVPRDLTADTRRLEDVDFGEGDFWGGDGCCIFGGVDGLVVVVVVVDCERVCVVVVVVECDGGEREEEGEMVMGMLLEGREDEEGGGRGRRSNGLGVFLGR